MRQHVLREGSVFKRRCSNDVYPGILDEVYALFRDDIKDEVPAGKGEGPTAAGFKRAL